MNTEEQRRKLERFFFGMDKIALERFAIQWIVYPESRAYLLNCVEEYHKAFSFPKLTIKED